MKKRVSLKDIAQKVGVSIALVSYVLNDQKLDRISKSMALKIRETAQELNYKTNHIARSLKTNKTHTIGLIVADISNSFSSTLARIIEDEAEQYGYTVIFCSSDESAERSQKLINVLLNHQVDGLIIAPTIDAEHQLKQLIEGEVPVVLVDRYYDDIPLSYIAIDNASASRTLTGHLIKNGHKRIGLITYDTKLNNLEDRTRGYCSSLIENGFVVDEKLIKKVSLQHVETEVEQAIDVLLAPPQPVDSILFAANTLSLIGLKHIVNLNIKVPGDLAIVAFDQTDAADLFYAPVTYIRQPLKQMGKLAIDTLMELIDHKEKLVQVKLKAELVIRKSSGSLSD